MNIKEICRKGRIINNTSEMNYAIMVVNIVIHHEYDN